MINTPLTVRARVFAYEKHKDQLDDSGEPYFFHCNQVAEIIGTVTNIEEVVAAAYLHDTIEDTNTTYEELEERFGIWVADLVMEVTHDGDETKGYYFPRLKSRWAIMIKFADRLSNISRMEPWSEKRRDHYLKRSQFWKTEKPV